MSGLEKRLERLLDELDISYVREEWAGKYRMDFYNFEAHISIETDGPHHALRRSQDKQRDAYLFAEFGIKTLRLGWKEVRNAEHTKKTVKEFITKWRPSALSRQLRSG